jgi:hypothetical protein
MFDLEQSIAEWRKQMLAAGIKSPVPLEELESHLREEIERRIQSGTSDQEAFQQTVLQIGHAKELKTEFAKSGGWLSWLGSDTFTTVNRILGILWLMLCSLAFVTIWREVFRHISRQGWENVGVLMGLSLLAAYGAGIGGSVLVICGTRLGRWTLGAVAVLFALISLFILLRPILTGEPIPIVKVGAFTAFYVITAWLMFLPSHNNVLMAKK